MQGTLFSLIALYRSSIEFTSLSDKTRKSYGRYLRLIEDDFGDMPIDALEELCGRLGDEIDQAAW
jgi:hypothetical protein